MSTDATTDTTTRDDFWQVQLASGEVCVWTLEELDEAFQSGQVHERTQVKKLGDEAWSTLAVVAGIEEEEAPVAMASPPQSLAPEAPAAVAPMIPPPPAAPAPVPTETLRSMESVPPAGPAALAPVAASVSPPSWNGPVSVPAASAAPSAAPVQRELEIEIEPQFKSRFRPLAVVGALAIVLGGLAVGAVKFAGAGSAPAAAGPSPNTVDVHHLGQNPTGDDPFIAKPLTDDQKRALLEADKKRAEELEKKRKAAEEQRAAQQPTRSRPAGKANDPFVKSNDKYDPLNGNL